MDANDPTNHRMSDKQRIGRIGEHLAARHLKVLNWEIIEQNWRCEYGEIDIIAKDGDTLVFVEVRTRRGVEAMQRALASVDKVKQKRLRRIIEAYLTEQPIPELVTRVDVVGVSVERTEFKVELVNDALTW